LQPDWRDAPTSGLDALEILGSVAHPEEPVAPFGPAAPLTRPPRAQSRLVLLVVGVLFVVLAGYAVTRFVDFHPAPLIAADPTHTPLSSATQASPSGAAASPSAGGSPGSAAPVSIAGIQALDPQGDGNENNDLASKAIDGNPATAWHSDRYNSPDFGGLKQGLGLAVDLGKESKVSTVTLTAPGADGTVELRVANGPDLSGSSVVATAQLTGNGKVVLTPAAPVSARELIVWFTRLPDSGGGGRRAVVAEIDVR
jgi:hypothetical protein